MLVHTVNRQLLLQLGTEKKLLPSTVINQVTKARAAELEEQQGFKPGRKQMKELKEQVTDELLPRAFSIRRSTFVWIDPVNGWLVVDAASPAKADEVFKLLLKSLEPLPFASLRTERSPQSAMTEWLAADEAPGRVYFKPEYDRIEWESGAAADDRFNAWCEGRTGYPLVDAAMAQIERTGYMHNRLRMVSACFLIKDLGIDWRRGERYFASS